MLEFTTVAAAQTDPAAHQLAGGGFWRVATMKADKRRAEVHLFGPIGMDLFGDGVVAKQFVDEINALDVSKIDMRVNSPGGSAFDGMTIATALMRHDAEITSWVDGMAASAASIVALAGDEVVASKYSQFMVHDARIFAGGTAAEMRAAADHLERLNGSIAQFYADRATSDADAKAWSKAMAKETWYNADEMLAAGLAHRIDTTSEREDVKDAATAMLHLAVAAASYQYAGRQAAPPPAGPTMKGSPTMATKTDVAKSLGLPDDATDEDIKAKLVELGLGDGGDTTQDGNGPAPVTETTDPPAAPAAAPAAAAASAGARTDDVVTLDRATYDAMLAGSAAGSAAMKALQDQADADVVDKAINDGRIMASRRDHYLAEMSADRAHVVDLLTNKLQPGAAVPLNEMGHGAGDVDTPDAQAAIVADPRFMDWKVG